MIQLLPNTKIQVYQVPVVNDGLTSSSFKTKQCELGISKGHFYA
jgi:hypothetical protein